MPHNANQMIALQFIQNVSYSEYATLAINQLQPTKTLGYTSVAFNARFPKKEYGDPLYSTWL